MHFLANWSNQGAYKGAPVSLFFLSMKVAHIKKQMILMKIDFFYYYYYWLGCPKDPFDRLSESPLYILLGSNRSPTIFFELNTNYACFFITCFIAARYQLHNFIFKLDFFYDFFRVFQVILSWVCPIILPLALPAAHLRITEQLGKMSD